MMFLATHLQLAACLARLRKVAQHRQCKLLEGRIACYDALQKRNSASDSSFFLSDFRKPAQIEERIDDMILDILQMVGAAMSYCKPSIELATHCAGLAIVLIRQNAN